MRRTLLAAVLFGGIASGCATAPAPMVPAGFKTIAIAQPLNYHGSIFINARDRSYSATSSYIAFCDALESELTKKGYTVRNYCARPNTIVVNNTLPAPKVSPQDADVLVIPSVELGYFALNVLHDFSQRITGQFTVIETKTGKTLFAGYARSIGQLNPAAPEYGNVDKLAADYDVARAALDRAGAALGKSMAERFP